MKRHLIALACAAAFGLIASEPASAQQLTSTAQAKVPITRGVSPASLRRKLEEELQVRAIRNVLETSFGVRMTPQIEAKLPELVEVLADAIEVALDPSDGEVLSGRARITVASARLQEIIRNKGIGAGDMATKSARILVSIDEYLGLATTLDGTKPTEVEVRYSHDKSTFSDNSLKAAGSSSESSRSASARTSDVAYAARQSSAASGSSSAAYAARQDTAVAGRRDVAVASQGPGGASSGAASSQYAGAQSTQVAGARSSQFAAANSSQVAYSGRSQSASSASASSSSSFAVDQKDVQQQNDKVSYSVRTKMPEFSNAKPLVGPDQVLTARLSGEFQTNGLRLVAENDLRAEGGRILPIWEITNNGRDAYFVEQIQRKRIEADVWATGTANYVIVGTTPTGTRCNGTLAVQGRFIDGNEIFFTDSLSAEATGNGDQNCRANLGIALATSLARVLGERANKELQARSSRGSVYTLYLYSLSSLGRGDRSKFQQALRKVDGMQASEPRLDNNFMAFNVQLAGSLDTAINAVLDAVAWDKADYVTRPGNRICIGLEGKHACPADLR